MQIQFKTEAGQLFFRHLLESFFHERAKDFRIEAHLEDGIASVFLEENGKCAHAKVAVNTALHGEKKRAEMAFLGAAFHEAAKHFSSYTPPYGTLVGVRPVKVPLFYRKKGLSVQKTEQILKDEFFVSPGKAKLLTALAETEQDFASSIQKKDAVLYLSIPFCPTRCSYCSFISSAAPSHLALIPQYVEALCNEIEMTAQLFNKSQRRLIAVYMGGGTPGILTPQQLKRILTCVKEHFDLDKLREFCVEMGRPDTITEEKLEVLADLGIDRISINPQTTCDETLQRIGRSHSAQDFYDAMKLARKFPFAVNCDLISALPGENGEVFLRSVEEVLSFAPKNITIHALCKKKSSEEKSATVFDPEFFDAVERAYNLCINQGLEPYYLYRQKKSALDLENLGFAQEGFLGVYNLAMMEDLCDVFACGAGGISKLIPKVKGGRILRFAGFKYPFEYLNQTERVKERLKEIQENLESEA